MKKISRVLLYVLVKSTLSFWPTIDAQPKCYKCQIIFDKNTNQKDTVDTSEITSLSWHQVDPLLAAAHDNGQIDIGVFNNEKQTIQHKQTLTGHTNKVTCLAWNPRLAWLASASFDKTIKFWIFNQETKKFELNRELTGHTKQISAIAWHPTKKLFATTSRDKTINIYGYDEQNKDFKLLQTLSTQNDQHTNWISAIAWHPTQAVLACAAYGTSGAIKLWKINESQSEFILEQTLTINRPYICSLEWHKTLPILLVGAGFSGFQTNNLEDMHIIKLLIYDSEKKRFVFSKTITGHSGCVNAATWYPDPDMPIFASGASDCIIGLWLYNAEKPKKSCYQSLIEHESGINALAWNPNTKYPILVSGDGDGKVIAWYFKDDGTTPEHKKDTANITTELTQKEKPICDLIERFKKLKICDQKEQN
ncbi:MAG: WD40 repeat domain-containing protein [bacterium]